MVKFSTCDQDISADQTVYQFEWETLDGHTRPMKEFEGRPLLIVNVASFCMFTEHYPKLNKLKDHFGDRLNIIAFPCNQFKLQEPGKNEEILNTIKYVRPGNGYEPNFPLSKIIEVNGENQHPLYEFLKRCCPSPNSDFKDRSKLCYEKVNANDIRWNFEKFLVTANGRPWRRYEPSTDPDELAAEIDELLIGEVDDLLTNLK